MRVLGCASLLVACLTLDGCAGLAVPDQPTTTLRVLTGSEPERSVAERERNVAEPAATAPAVTSLKLTAAQEPADQVDGEPVTDDVDSPFGDDPPNAADEPSAAEEAMDAVPPEAPEYDGAMASDGDAQGEDPVSGAETSAEPAVENETSAAEPPVTEAADRTADEEIAEAAESEPTPITDPAFTIEDTEAPPRPVDPPAANPLRSAAPDVPAQSEPLYDEKFIDEDGQAEVIVTPGPVPRSPFKPGPAESDLKRFERQVTDVPLDIRPTEGDLPEDLAAKRSAEQPVIDETWPSDAPPDIFCGYTPWTICYRPLYFEDIPLERYGNNVGCLQTGLSGVRFYGSILALPYKMAVHPPRTCQCSNGFSRCGDCPLPGYGRRELRLDASLIETAAIVGVIYILP